ncbi:MAG: hypothetical protein JW793_10130 [Acidobacteria bacterium]|nr:hypothetical protein [Acidobacteriota bacterium]
MFLSNFVKYKTSLLILACAVMVLAASAVAQTTPENKAVPAVLQYCPPNAAAVIQIDTKTFAPIARDFLQAFLDLMREDKTDGSLPPGMEVAFQKAAECTRLIETNFDTMQLYLISGQEKLLLVLRGTPGREDVVRTLMLSLRNAFLAASRNANPPEDLPEPTVENGRYTAPGLPFIFIEGKVASDLPDDVVLCGMPGAFTPEFVDSLGKTPPAVLVSLLKNVDTAKPLWAVGVIPLRNPDAPQTFYGWLNPAGTGDLKITFSFVSKQSAEAGFQDMLEKFTLTDFLQCRVHENDVTISLVPSDVSFQKRFSAAILAGITRARTMAKQAVAKVRLRGLGTAIELYNQAEGKSPADWGQLVDEGYCSAKNLLNPLSRHPDPKWNPDTKKLEGEVDFVLLDYSGLNRDTITQPDKVLSAYAKPEVYKNFPYLGIPVLFVDGHVAEMDAELLEKYILGAKAVRAGRPLPELPPIPVKNPPPSTMPAAKAPGGKMTEFHCYCLETKKEFVIKPEDMRNNMGGNIDINDFHIYSPFTKKRTAVPMTRCPNCEKYFVPEYLLKMDKGEKVEPKATDLICPHCKTDVIQWYRDHRKKRNGQRPEQRKRRPRRRLEQTTKDLESF